MAWVHLKQDIIHQDKGYLEGGKNYNLPKKLAQDLIKSGKASEELKEKEEE